MMRATTLAVVYAVVVVTVLVALGGEGATAAALPHPHRHRRRHEGSRKRVVHLQDTVDRLLLQQKIDQIHLTNLQKAVQDLQERDAPSVSSLSASVSKLEVEEHALSALREKVAEVRGTMTEALQAEEHRDEMTQIRQELAYLRSELLRVKETRASDSVQSKAHTQAQEQREAVTSAWVVDNVKRLQDSVVDLQQALNVTQAMHDKQEVESRLTVVTKDLSVLRGSLAAVTSKAEAAAAMSAALEEDLTRTTEAMHRTAGQTGALSSEVSAIREDFNNLLAALPEGTVAGTAASPPATGGQVGVAGAGVEGVAAVVGRAAEARQTQRITALEQRTDQLDFALTRAQQQLSSVLPGSVKEEQVAEVAETERQLERKVEALRTGVGEVRSSSVQLLAALEALEARMEREVKEMKQEVAKLEFKVAESAAAQQTRKQDARVVHDDTAALRSDLQDVSRRLDHFTLKMATLEGRKLENDVAIAQCRAQYLSLDLKLNDTTGRLTKVEQQHGSRGGHTHHLRPWSQSSLPDNTSRSTRRRRRSG